MSTFDGTLSNALACRTRGQRQCGSPRWGLRPPARRATRPSSPDMALVGSGTHHLSCANAAIVPVISCDEPATDCERTNAPCFQPLFFRCPSVAISPVRSVPLIGSADTKSCRHFPLWRRCRLGAASRGGVIMTCPGGGRGYSSAFPEPYASTHVISTLEIRTGHSWRCEPHLPSALSSRHGAMAQEDARAHHWY